MGDAASLEPRAPKSSWEAVWDVACFQTPQGPREGKEGKDHCG